MADGKTKVDVEVKIRPLTGYWLPKEETNSSHETKSRTAETISGISLLSGLKFVYKKDDKLDLKTVWASNSASGPATPPKVSTPLPTRKNKDGWEPMLGQEDKKEGWRSAFSKEPTMEIKKEMKTTTSASGCTGCRCRKRKKKLPSLKKTKSEKKIVDVPKEQMILVQTPKVTSGEVLVELVSPHPPTDDHHFEYIFLEARYWAVLGVFWAVLLVYRLMAYN